MLIRLTNIASSYIVTPINVVMALWSQWFMFSEVAKAIASKFCIRVGIRCQGCWHVVNLWPVPDFNWRSEGDGKPDYFYAQRCGDFRFFTPLRCVQNDRVSKPSLFKLYLPLSAHRGGRDFALLQGMLLDKGLTDFAGCDVITFLGAIRSIIALGFVWISADAGMPE